MSGMSPIVQTVARWVRAFIIIFGIYVVAYGHLSPGGGFAGGVVISCAFILTMLAMGREACERKCPLRWAARLDALGALGFAALALLGFTAGTFFRNFLDPGRAFALASAGSVPLANLAIGLKISACLFLVFAALSVTRLLPPAAKEPEEVPPAPPEDAAGPSPPGIGARPAAAEVPPGAGAEAPAGGATAADDGAGAPRAGSGAPPRAGSAAPGPNGGSFRAACGGSTGGAEGEGAWRHSATRSA